MGTAGVGVGVDVPVGEGDGVTVGESVAVDVAVGCGEAVAVGRDGVAACVSAAASVGDDAGDGGGAGARHPARSRKIGKAKAKTSRISADFGFLCFIACIIFVISGRINAEIWLFGMVHSHSKRSLQFLRQTSSVKRQKEPLRHALTFNALRLTCFARR